ncbi:unnamed protein product [Absidia cylindrospora]
MEETDNGSLSTEDIKSKLATLREEKHNMFQLLKRLVEQEEQQQRKCQAEKEEERRQQSEQAQLQSVDQQEQHDIKKKKTSRWSSPIVSPSTAQRPFSLPRHHDNNSNTIITTTKHTTPTAALASSWSFHTHGGSHVYLGRQQSAFHRPHQPPYLY